MPVTGFFCIGVCRAVHETKKRKGGRGEHIQVFSPIMACIFSPGPSASTFNIPSRARASARGSFLRKYWFLLESFSLLEQTASKGGGREVFPSFLHLFHGSWKVIAEQVVWKGPKTSSSSVEGTKEEKSNFGGGERATDISDTERGERFAPHSLFYMYSPALKSIQQKNED